MRKRTKRRTGRNKYGSTTVFLSMILTAIVLVECSFIAIMWDYDKRLEMSRAVKIQLQSVLSDYNRQLFEVYGIYAFNKSKVDTKIFNRCLEANGCDEMNVVRVEGFKPITAKELKRAIASYYTLRWGGFTGKRIVNELVPFIKSADKFDICGKIKKLTSGGAGKYLKLIIDGKEKISGDEEDEDYKTGEKVLGQIASLVKRSGNDLSKLSPDLSADNLGYVADCLNYVNSYADKGQDLLSGKASKFALAHYAAYNFDCQIENDKDETLDKTSFNDIHTDNKCDAEYILSGNEGKAGCANVESLIFAVCFIKEYMNCNSDPLLTTALPLLADAIAAVVLVVTEGAVALDPGLVETGLKIIVAACHAAGSVSNVVDGETVSLIEKDDDKGLINLGYRDFVFMYMCLVPEESVSERVLNVLSRDFGEMSYSLTVHATYGVETFERSAGYALYA